MTIVSAQSYWASSPCVHCSAYSVRAPADLVHVYDQHSSQSSVDAQCSRASRVSDPSLSVSQAEGHSCSYVASSCRAGAPAKEARIRAWRVGDEVELGRCVGMIWKTLFLLFAEAWVGLHAASGGSGSERTNALQCGLRRHRNCVKLSVAF